ncbi:MAG: VOC family protein [Chloroflexota bacterium]
MNTQPAVTNTTSISPDTEIGAVALTVSDLERSLAFYENVLGFRVLNRIDNSAVLGTDDKIPLLTLTERKGATPQPRRSTGLYHFAILLPSRADLGRSLQHLLDSNYPLAGASDHLVSEALYLSDPDNNGIEIYRDRPRAEWQWGNGQVVMATDPLDLRGVLTESTRNPSPWTGLAAGTRIGHIHLQVGDIPLAAEFYHRVMGFDVVTAMSSALFISAGGYHHHIGLNTWSSLRAPQPPEGSAGLRFFTITLPNSDARQQVLTRLEDAHIPFETHGENVIVRDPWNNAIWLTVGTLKDDALLS